MAGLAQSRGVAQRPIAITLKLTVQRNGAKPEHLERFLKEAIEEKMEEARFASAAGSVLLDLSVSSKEVKR